MTSISRSILARHRHLKHQRGFTLVELMVVVAIIGILAAVGIPSMRKFILAAETAEAVDTAGRIEKGIQGYAASQSLTLAELKTAINAENVVIPGNASASTLSVLIPTITVPSTAKFQYTVNVEVPTDQGDTAEALAVCVRADKYTSGAADTTHYVLFSSAAAKIATGGWENNVNRSAYITGNAVTVAGGYCSADTPTASATAN